MKPDTSPPQLSAFVDGELELSLQLAIEARIGQDPALRAQLQRLRSLGKDLRTHADYHPAPAALRQRLQALAEPAPVKQPPASRRPWFSWQPLALGLSAVALLAWTIGVALWPLGREEQLMQDAIASHVRATLGQRLVDVASSDQHTVKPWLSSRLDYSPPVHDPQLPGVVFLGGRVDYLDGRPVAVLVYQQRQHVIDAFVWPTQGADTHVKVASQRGFNTRHWSHAGMSYWVISDLNATELAALAQPLERGDVSR